MSVIAWDGTVLAADRQATICGRPIPVTKIFRHGKEIIGGTGQYQECVAFIEWYTKSQIPSEKPKVSDNFVALVVKEGKLWRYESLLVPFIIDEPFWAAGCGADYAVGAMASGKNAVEAVEIACQFDTDCGLGVDFLEYGA